jgi:hypothetical protein
MTTSTDTDAAFRATLKAIYRDGTTAPAVIPPSLQVAFEREFDVGFPTFLASFPNWRIERFYWLAWKVLGAGAEFDPWLTTVDAVEIDSSGVDDDDRGV